MRTYRYKGRCRLLLAALLAVTAYGEQPGGRSDAAGPPAQMAPVTISVTMQPLTRGVVRVDVGPGVTYRPHELKVGTGVSICVTASATGFITIWSTDSGNKVERIYPNDFSFKGERGAPIKAGEALCIGQEDSFGLAVAGPLGVSRVSAHWTRRQQDNWPPEAFETVDRGLDEDHADARFDYVVKP